MIKTVDLPFELCFAPAALNGFALIKIAGFNIINPHEGAIMRPSELRRKPLGQFSAHWAGFFPFEFAPQRGLNLIVSRLATRWVAFARFQKVARLATFFITPKLVAQRATNSTEPIDIDLIECPEIF